MRRYNLVYLFSPVVFMLLQVEIMLSYRLSAVCRYMASPSGLLAEVLYDVFCVILSHGGVFLYRKWTLVPIYDEK